VEVETREIDYQTRVVAVVVATDQHTQAPEVRASLSWGFRTPPWVSSGWRVGAAGVPHRPSRLSRVDPGAGRPAT
jgi:hypothetical protein